MQLLTRSRVIFDVALGEYAQNLPYYFFSFGILVGTIITTVFIVWLGDKIIGGSLSKPWSKFVESYVAKTKRSRASYGRLFFMFLAILIFMGGMTAAATVIGFSFWNIMLGYGILTYLVGAMMGQPLACIGAYIFISWTDKIECEQWIILTNQNIQGRIISINLLFVEMEYIDEKKDKNSIRSFQIPTSTFISNNIERSFQREALIEIVQDDFAGSNKIMRNRGLLSFNNGF